MEPFVHAVLIQCTSCSPGWVMFWCNKSKTNLIRLILISFAKKTKPTHGLARNENVCLSTVFGDFFT